MPADGDIEVAFDRYLLPSTAVRQSFGLLDGNNKPLELALAPLVIYDPVARTITLSNPGAPGQEWLRQGQLYKLALGVPDGDADLGGFRAVDRAPLARAQRRLIEFFVGPPAGRPNRTRVDVCADVLPIFAAKCGGSTCHGAGDGAAAGLVLTTADGIATTAFGRAAQGGNTGGRAGAGTETRHTFGVDMPLIAPGDPGNSWLLYKLELAALPPDDAAPAPASSCAEGSDAAVALPESLVPGVSPASAAERERLGNLVLGSAMPMPAGRTGYAGQALTWAERERVRLWIAGLSPGDTVPSCPPCTSSEGGPR